MFGEFYLQRDAALQAATGRAQLQLQLEYAAELLAELLNRAHTLKALGMAWYDTIEAANLDAFPHAALDFFDRECNEARLRGRRARLFGEGTGEELFFASIESEESLAKIGGALVPDGYKHAAAGTGALTTEAGPTLPFIGSGTGAIAHEGSGTGALVPLAEPGPTDAAGCLARVRELAPRCLERGLAGDKTLATAAHLAGGLAEGDTAMAMKAHELLQAVLVRQVTDLGLTEQEVTDLFNALNDYLQTQGYPFGMMDGQWRRDVPEVAHA